MPEHLKFILSSAKAITGFVLGWLVSNQSQAAEMVIYLGQQIGLAVPDTVAAGLVGFLVALAVWLVPNKTQ